MAYAAALFADSCLRGLNGIPTVECSYVDSSITDAPFFATKVKLSTEGEWPSCPSSRLGMKLAREAKLSMIMIAQSAPLLD
jgi:hypothetical protein